MFKYLLRVNIGICLLFLYGQAEMTSKRLPMGFQGMRGKKSVDLSLEEEFPDPDRSLSISWLRRLLMTSPPSYEYPFKRSPSGFIGMRGKKEDNFDGQSDNLFFDLNGEEKRGQLGFHGMRGKKQQEYPSLSYANKRLMGFHGMRGKKSDIDDLYKMNNMYINAGDVEYPYYGDPTFYSKDFAKKNLMGFQGMRGKRDFTPFNQNERVLTKILNSENRSDDGLDHDLNNEEYLHDENNTKEDLNDENNTKEKGMKETIDATILPSPNINELLGLNQYGNEDVTSYTTTNHVVKRSPNFNIFGVRGKKMPFFTALFGNRGKKMPFDAFRGKFVGMRGKKSDVNHLYDSDSIASWIGDYQKRGNAFGFYGVRGKKSVNSESTPGKTVNIESET